ncbi:MAG: 3'-5' exonuclease [Lachnospiraceae bacterium]|nr:3'-5' exonuclease [Lachnospiraceae bacterium]
MTNSYISIDLETTGLNPKLDKIIEIGGVKVLDGKVTDTFSTFISPGMKLKEQVVELTGIRDEMLTDAPPLDEVMPKLRAFLEELPLLGHRILFDYSFLKKAAVDRKLTFEKKGLDTLKIARRYLPGLEHRTLEFLCNHYGIGHTAHRALGDAMATHELYQILARDYCDRQDDLFCPKKLIFQVKRDTPITKAQKERLYRLLDQHKIVIDANVESMTRSEADRTIDRIIGRKYVTR